MRGNTAASIPFLPAQLKNAVGAWWRCSKAGIDCVKNSASIANNFNHQVGAIDLNGIDS